MWDLVGNPEDRFSHNEAHILMVCCRYRWKRNGIDYYPASDDGRVSLAEGSLVFLNPQSNDEASYQCYAENKYGTAVSRNFHFMEAYLDDFSPSEPEV